MTAAEFRASLKALGLTIGAFAALVGVNVTTAGYWGRERPGCGIQEFPAWVPLLLDAWRATGVPASPSLDRSAPVNAPAPGI